MKRMSKIYLAVLALALVVALAAPALAGEMKGKVMSVDPDRLAFVIQTDDKGKTVPFLMDEDASVYINQEEKSLHDLKPGDHVSIVGRQDENQWLAIEVRADRK